MFTHGAVKEQRVITTDRATFIIIHRLSLDAALVSSQI